MADGLDRIEESITQRNFEQPPLHLWNPPLSGDIDIRIAADGRWYHEGGEIRREALVRLFASILRREGDGDYYLVTPAEKWRIVVENHPLIVVGVDAEGEGDSQRLTATLNTGRRVAIGADHGLSLDATLKVAVLSLPHQLTALFNRNAWYQLVEMADDTYCVTSEGATFSLSDEEPVPLS